LIDRRVADALRSLPEKVRFLRGLIPWLGFKQIGIPINRDARALGESAYTLKKLLSLAFDGLLAFSVLPLYFILLAGIIELLLALGALVGYTTFGAHTHIFNPALIGIILLFVGGIQILSIGIVAVYLSKVVEEVRGRPTYIVAEKRGLIYSKDVTPDESEVLHTRAKTEKFYSQK
jgi:dolichol-phosphate mannosyltransferase